MSLERIRELLSQTAESDKQRLLTRVMEQCLERWSEEAWEPAELLASIESVFAQPSDSDESEESADASDSWPEDIAGVLERLRALSAVLESVRSLLPAKATSFLDKAPEALLALSLEERQSRAGFGILKRTLKSLDKLAQGTLFEPYRKRMLPVLNEALGCLFEHLREQHSVDLFPQLIGEPQLEGERLTEGRQMSPEPEGLVLAVVQRRGLGEDQETLVSAGFDNDDFVALARAYGAAVTACASDEELPREHLEALRRPLESFESLDEGAVKTRLQYSLNYLVRMNSPGRLAKAQNKLRERLLARGLKEIPARLGEPYDHRFKEKDYEVSFRRSEKPAGTVFQLARPGFKDEHGITVQRCHIYVAS